MPIPLLRKYCKRARGWGRDPLDQVPPLITYLSPEGLPTARTTIHRFSGFLFRSGPATFDLLSSLLLAAGLLQAFRPEAPGDQDGKGVQTPDPPPLEVGRGCPYPPPRSFQKLTRISRYWVPGSAKKILFPSLLHILHIFPCLVVFHIKNSES